jgi:hypothetical protein
MKCRKRVNVGKSRKIAVIEKLRLVAKSEDGLVLEMELSGNAQYCLTLTKGEVVDLVSDLAGAVRDFTN